MKTKTLDELMNEALADKQTLTREEVITLINDYFRKFTRNSTPKCITFDGKEVHFKECDAEEYTSTDDARRMLKIISFSYASDPAVSGMIEKGTKKIGRVKFSNIYFEDCEFPKTQSEYEEKVFAMFEKKKNFTKFNGENINQYTTFVAEHSIFASSTFDPLSCNVWCIHLCPERCKFFEQLEKVVCYAASINKCKFSNILKVCVLTKPFDGDKVKNIDNLQVAKIKIFVHIDFTSNKENVCEFVEQANKILQHIIKHTNIQQEGIIFDTRFETFLNIFPQYTLPYNGAYISNGDMCFERNIAAIEHRCQIEKNPHILEIWRQLMFDGEMLYKQIGVPSIDMNVKCYKNALHKLEKQEKTKVFDHLIPVCFVEVNKMIEIIEKRLNVCGQRKIFQNIVEYPDGRFEDFVCLMLRIDISPLIDDKNINTCFPFTMMENRYVVNDLSINSCEVVKIIAPPSDRLIELSSKYTINKKINQYFKKVCVFDNFEQQKSFYIKKLLYYDFYCIPKKQ